MAVTAVVVALTAVGSSNWRGGPVGYAFAGPLLAPTSAASALGTLAGTAVFLGLFAVTVRAALRRVPDRAALAVWMAALVASVGLGVVGAVVAALTGHLDDAGPDSWWIATTLISVATGIGYGVGVGLLAALATAVTWRWRARVLPSGRGTPRRRRARRPWIVAGTVVVLLAVPLVVPTTTRGPEAVAPVPASGGMERLHLLPAQTSDGLPVIGDVTGRRVLLRGVNVNQLIDYYLRDPAVPATQKPTDEDFAQIASYGFSVVRLGMSWSRLEPRRGEFDEAYLDEVRAAVASAKAHGLYTVLDMHEDAWGNALAAPDEQCGGGTSPTTGWDGAPAWATITDGALHCQFMARDLAPAVATAYSNFYTDRDGIQTELVRTWATVAKAFADEPAVAGLRPVQRAGHRRDPAGQQRPAARAVLRRGDHGDPRGGDAPDSRTWSSSSRASCGPGSAFDVTPPPGFTSDAQLVFAPHPYSESITPRPEPRA